MKPSDPSETHTRTVACSCLAVRQAARQITQMYDAELAPTGLRITQYSVLALLDRSGPTSLQNLADSLVMDRSTLGHNLRPLEREGLVRIATDRTDRRSRRLELTTIGKSKLDDARPHWKKAQRRFETSYGKGDAQDLRSVMRRVVDGAGK